MSGISITTDQRDLGRMSGRVMNFLANLANPRELLEGFGDVLLLNIDRRFEEGRGPDGAPWEPTARGGQILVKTARYRNSFDKRVTDRSVAAGTNVIYASTHQKGAVIKPKRARLLAFTIGGVPVFAKQVTIPARPVLGIADDDIKGMRGVLAEFIRAAKSEARP
ncbi:phage virion morphogenesis protein [Thalassospira alkalitolerans]|uniref:phage virion morphogenesis protein n=1 Tax=Thalassospira alkalitolerans TaxID=1293890 RepID=UPI000A1E9125|nr:phage virion morphogenesis protein [Thalassospira alkalitolerans]